MVLSAAEAAGPSDTRMGSEVSAKEPLPEIRGLQRCAPVQGWRVTWPPSLLTFTRFCGKSSEEVAAILELWDAVWR